MEAQCGTVLALREARAINKSLYSMTEWRQAVKVRVRF